MSLPQMPIVRSAIRTSRRPSGSSTLMSRSARRFFSSRTSALTIQHSLATRDDHGTNQNRQDRCHIQWNIGLNETHPQQMECDKNDGADEYPVESICDDR